MTSGEWPTEGTRSPPTAHELTAFLRLSEDPHFGRTARRLGVAQSSLSETIRRLEAKLDVVLFERSSRRVSLTSAGADLVPRARRVLDSLAAVSGATAPAPGSERLRVGVEAHGFAELNRPILAGQIARQPTVPVVVQECPGLPQAFLDGGFDVALLRTPLEDERLAWHPVATEARGLVVHLGHPAAGTEGSSALEFLDEPFIALGPAVPRTRDYWLGCELRGGEPARVGGEADNVADALFGIAHLRLNTLGCRSAVRAYPMAGIAFVGTTDVCPNTLSVVTRAGDLRPIVTGFVDLVRSVVSRFAGLAPGIDALSEPDAGLTRRGSPAAAG
jgi:DNA-binding transcriptional LysR family regulator